jgi:H+/Cl- antiporter ClcA
VLESIADASGWRGDESDLVNQKEELPKKSLPVSMPSIGKTLVFPREDNVYRGKESIAYDENQTQVWRDRPRMRKSEHLKEWKAYLYVGVFVGIIGFIMAFMEETISAGIVKLFEDSIQENLHSDSQWLLYIRPWLIYAGLSGLCGLFAGTLTTYYGQGAAGSGVAEFIGFINGINYPNFISVPTLITKIFGVSFAVIGKLCVGKEGPLAHIGTIVGIGVLYLPGQGFECLRNDEKRRQLAAAGCSAGVSVAFGAPIGGTLFSYEMSKPNTFWRFTMIWKVFLSCSIGTFFLALLQNLKAGNIEG